MDKQDGQDDALQFKWIQNGILKILCILVNEIRNRSGSFFWHSVLLELHSQLDFDPLQVIRPSQAFRFGGKKYG